MRVVYLANVGTQEVQRNGKRLEKPRLDGAELLANYEAVRGELSTPILSAGIGHVLQTADTIERVQLFVSDQPAPPVTLERHWERDTIELGKLLQRLLQEQFGERLQRIECEPMRFNPSDYNRTLPFFAERLPLLIPPDGVDAVYVAPVGGTDASNVGLTINAVRTYREKCQFIYVPERGSVQVLRLHEELLGDYARQEAKAHLARHNYAALRETLKQAHLGKPWHQHLCDYADHRMRFDFQRAEEALQAAIGAAEGGEIRLKLARLQETLQPFLREQAPPTSASDEATWTRWFELQRQLLSELFFNLQLKAERGEWVDFLGRLFRLYEAVLRLIFELETRHSTEKHEDSGFEDFSRAIEANTELHNYLVKKRVRFQEANTRNLMLALEFWVRHGKGKEYGRLRDTLNVIASQELSSLRHKTIIAHGYRGVSREDVQEAAGMPVEQLIEELRNALDAVGASTEEESNPYTTLQKLLQTAVKPS